MSTDPTGQSYNRRGTSAQPSGSGYRTEPTDPSQRTRVMKPDGTPLDGGTSTGVQPRYPNERSGYPTEQTDPSQRTRVMKPDGTPLDGGTSTGLQPQRPGQRSTYQPPDPNNQPEGPIVGQPYNRGTSAQPGSADYTPPPQPQDQSHNGSYHRTSYTERYTERTTPQQQPQPTEQKSSSDGSSYRVGNRTHFVEGAYGSVAQVAPTGFTSTAPSSSGAVFTQLRDTDAGLGSLAAPAMSALGNIAKGADPVKALVGSVVGPLLDILVAALPPLRWPLDVLAGNQEAISEHAMEWQGVAQGIASAGGTYASSYGEVESWSNPAADGYRQSLKDVSIAFEAASTQCASVSESITIAGQVCAGVRDFIWGLVKEFIMMAIETGIAAFAASFISAGGSVAAYMANLQANLAKVMAEVSAKLFDLNFWMGRAAERFASLAQLLGQSAMALIKLSQKQSQPLTA